MTISFELPQNIEQRARTNGADLNREAKVAYLIDLYRRSGPHSIFCAAGPSS